MLCIRFTLALKVNRDRQSEPHELANQALVECQVWVSHYRLCYKY